ncbi:hypothetical protein C5167_009706 [Papaver somniferum]|uniref:Uncharacterized protein n=1 Tax=Papaver somniferum TaxID=3469 RepID=A0A4Y7K125_PAPSO|nr:hypothetical protein C5167_009706 [Papaver somniferum]
MKQSGMPWSTWKNHVMPITKSVEYTNMSTGENSTKAAGLLPKPASDPQAGMKSSSSGPSEVLTYFPLGPRVERNIDDVNKTMDEINEHTENMKQVQGALSNPIGAAAEFNELVIFVGCRVNCNLNSRSWRINFYNLQPKVRFKSSFWDCLCILKRISLLLASLGVKLERLCREKNHLLIFIRGLHFHVLLRLSSGVFISSSS